MSSETSNYNLSKPKKGLLGWDVPMNSNLDTINNQHETTQNLVDNTSSIISSYIPSPKYLGYNMGFDIAQRGTFITSTTDEYTLDLWKKTGVNATIERVSGTSIPSGEFNSDYCMKVTLDATGLCTLSNEIPLPKPYNDMYKFLRGKTVTFACDVFASAASLASISIYDGIDDTVSGTSTHTGGGSVERLLVTKTISNIATEITVRLKVTGALSDVAYFANSAFAIGNFSSLDYFTRNPAEDWIACLGFYQKYTQLKYEWSSETSTEETSVTINRKYTLNLPIPMVATPTVNILSSGTEIGSTKTLSITAEDQSTLTVNFSGTVNETLSQGRSGISIELIAP